MTEASTDRSMLEAETVPIYSSLYSRHSRNYVEGVSREVCNIMTLLGYGEEIRRRRVKKVKEYDMLFNAHLTHDPQAIITAGSKAEGLTCLLESDLDSLFVQKWATCVEAGVDLHTIPDGIEVYRMDKLVYPGHCRMLLERRGTKRYIDIINALCDDGKGNAMLSSGLFLDEISKVDLKSTFIIGKLGRAGPSLAISNGLGETFDFVCALRCHCPGIVQRWAQRPRLWPPPDVVQKVVSLGSFVTPVGLKGSEYSYLEWRICFNTGETELVNNLHGTQAKVYVILKMIVKGVLKPNNKEITSYVLKNVVFWQAESNSPAMFQERNLIHWLHDALGRLRTAITSIQLPYYMIPERNLLAACGMHAEQRRKWVADITHMMDEGQRVILRLPKIRQAVICYPEPLLWFSSRRMELEMLILECKNRLMQCADDNLNISDSDIILQEIGRLMEEVLRQVYHRMLREGSAASDLSDIFKRILM